MNQEPKDSWEEEFDKQFEYLRSELDTITDYVGGEHLEPIKSFIRKVSQKSIEDERERIVKLVSELHFEESPPFSADDTFRRQTELINEHLMPHIKEYLLSLISKK